MQAMHAHGHSQHAAPATEGRLIHWAHLYDPLVWFFTMGQTRKLRSLPSRLARVQPGDRVLDVGCGTGDVTLAAARRAGRVGRVWGIDASPEMIDVARRKARRQGYGVDFAVQPVEELAFPDGSFDVVLSSLMMHHLPGDLKPRALGEITRVLRPGGRLVIVDFGPGGNPTRPLLFTRIAMHVHAALNPHASEVGSGLSDLVRILEEVGFVDVESGPTGIAIISYARGRTPGPTILEVKPED